MSYRAFKRLLGETSLERKCRFLLGTGILLLMTLSFWVYARQTESLAYDQSTTTPARLLVPGIVAELHVKSDSREAMKQFQQVAEKTWPDALREYKYTVLKPGAVEPEHKPEGDETGIFKQFLNDPEKNEDTRTVPSQGAFYYFAAVRAEASCLKCHAALEEKRQAGLSLAEGDLMAVVSIRLSTRAIESGFHVNRAL